MKTKLQIRQSVSLGLLLCALVVSPALAQGPSVQMLKVYPVGTQTCVSTSIAMPEGQALSGLSWYANDSQVQFPMVILMEGIQGQAPDLSNAAMILAEVSGQSLAWDSFNLSTPVLSSTGRIDVVFVYPQDSEIQALGEGGGPGIGIIADGGGEMTYLSHDGFGWARFEPSYRLAVEPVFVSAKVATEATLLSSMKDSVDRSLLASRPEQDDPAVRLQTRLSVPYPNPFNPRTVIRFELARAGQARLAIYDVRGRLVVTLLDGAQPAGAQELLWQGVDGRGRSVASGSYFVVLEAGGNRHTQKLALLR